MCSIANANVIREQLFISVFRKIFGRRRHDATEQHDATAHNEGLDASRYQLSDQD